MLRSRSEAAGVVQGPRKRFWPCERMEDLAVAQQRYGPRMLSERQIVERFRSYFLTGQEDQCWEWLGSRSKGYGRITINCGTELAHRISWIVHIGPIPAGLNVLHHCDNPCCVNPSHLFVGTQTDNNRDCSSKG